MQPQDKDFTIGIDLSGAKLKICVFKEERPEFIDLVKEELDLYSNTPEYVRSRIGAVLDDVLQRTGLEASQCDAIGVALPGATEDRKVENDSNDFTFIKSFLHDRYSVPVFLENDANMAALGEHAFGAGQGAKDMVLLLLGTSVGAGLILNGKLYRGNLGQAGDVGQMIIDEQGASEWYECPICKDRGCADSMASETAIVVMAKDALRKGRKIGNLTFEDVAAVKVHDVIQAAKDGDQVAQEITRKVAKNISVVVYNLIVTLDPDTLVIGGRLSRHFDFLFPLVEEYLEQKSYILKNTKTQIVKNQIAGDTGLLGALIIKKS